MQYRPLGNSGLLVSELALGTMVFGEENTRGTPKKEAIEIIHAFIDAGGNHIDTANVYADGVSEQILGEAIRGKREKLVIATKVRFSMGDDPNQTGLSRYHILNSVEASLQRLQTDHIDLLYMHAWDPITPIEESLHAFDTLVTQGKVRYIGVSNFKAWQLMKALSISDRNRWARFIAAQYQYNLVTRDIEDEFSDLCLEEGVGITPWSPLGGGFLTGKYKRDADSPSGGRIAVMPDHAEEAWNKRATEKNWEILDVMAEIAAQHENMNLSHVAIQWLLAQKAVSSVIIGVRTMAHLQDNLKAVDFALSPDEVTRLNQISQPPSRYPYRFLQNYGAR